MEATSKWRQEQAAYKRNIRLYVHQNANKLSYGAVPYLVRFTTTTKNNRKHSALKHGSEIGHARLAELVGRELDTDSNIPIHPSVDQVVL